MPDSLTPKLRAGSPPGAAPRTPAPGQALRGLPPSAAPSAARRDGGGPTGALSPGRCAAALGAAQRAGWAGGTEARRGEGVGLGARCRAWGEARGGDEEAGCASHLARHKHSPGRSSV